MADSLPAGLSPALLQAFILALADDELILGHRDSEWTGHAPILEEDIAFSNIAQDEIGHAFVWFTLYQAMTGKDPDNMAFERSWGDFTNCTFVEYPKGDFAYTVIRQYLFDAAEQIRLKALGRSSYQPVQEAANKLIREEEYHLMHSQGLVERLGDATEESHFKMQAALDKAFPQALGLFEPLSSEEELVQSGIFSGNEVLKNDWQKNVSRVLREASLSVPAESGDGDIGGRRKEHTQHLKQLVDDMQSVYRTAPGPNW